MAQSTYTETTTETNAEITTGKSPVGPQAFPLVENDPWKNTPPQELTVPEGGNKARKSTYVERCDQCQVDITQEMDACKACGRPVHWTGSHIADKRYERQAEKKVDMTAADRRADESKLSEPLRFLLACSRSSPASFKTHFALGEAEALQALVEAYGGQILKDKANEFKANGEQGRGLIKHVLAFLRQYNPSAVRAAISYNAIITDNEELGRQNEAWLVAHGRQSKPEEEDDDPAFMPYETLVQAHPSGVSVAPTEPEPEVDEDGFLPWTGGPE